MKNNTLILIAAGLAALFLFKNKGQVKQQIYTNPDGSSYTIAPDGTRINILAPGGVPIQNQFNPGAAGQFPAEPADKKSAAWVKWVQLVILIAGGLFPELFGKDGPFAGKPINQIQAANFFGVNMNLNPGFNPPGFNLNAGRFGPTTYFNGLPLGFKSGYGLDGRPTSGWRP